MSSHFTQLPADSDEHSKTDDARHQMTLDALREVDDGKVIDHEVIEAWLDTLE